MDRKGRRDNSDTPIYSRLYVICGKNAVDDDLKTAFRKYGTIEEIHMPVDRVSGVSKGIAYIKFSKTSEAARALEEMNNKRLPNVNSCFLKVKVACNKSEVQVEDDNYKYRRLFITIPQNATEDDIQAGFEKFGRIQDIQIQKDRATGQAKGFAYVSFANFTAAAIAYEECERKYRAIFAMPRSAKKPETAFISNVQSLARSSNNVIKQTNSLLSVMNVRPSIYTRVRFKCCPRLLSYNVEKLFNIVPGLINFEHHVDLLNNFGTGLATYSNPVCAAYAVEKLNLFEYPPGIQIFVRPDHFSFDPNEQNSLSIPKAVHKLQRVIEASSRSSAPDLDQLAQAIAEASKLIEKTTAGVTDNCIPDSSDLKYCSAKLPPPKPLADINLPAAKRCFLVCKPTPPPSSVLRDVFCRFGDLISVYTLPNKTIGYACYATAEAADSAIRTLHGAEVCGVRIKVIEADEEAPPKRARHEN